MLDPHDIANLLLTVTFAASFIGLFFFSYAAKIEKEIVIAQINYLTTDFTDSLKIFIPDESKTGIKLALENVKEANMADVDKYVEDSNKKLMKQAFTVIAIMLVIGLVGSYWISKKYGLDYKELVIRNLIILGAIAVVEFIFATFIAKQFISADPNYVKRIISNTLENYSKGKV